MNNSDLSRDSYMLLGALKKKGYDWWWHSFTAYNAITKEERPFFIEFYVINPALSDDKVILGQDPENIKARKKPSYAMLNVGTWGENACQLHQFFPIRDIEIEYPLSVRFADNILTESYMKGAVHVSKEDSMNPGYMCDAGDFSFDLKIDKKICFNVGYGASKFFRKLNAFEMFWHAEGMKTEYQGTIQWNGETYLVEKEKSFGYADKNWGSNYTSPWVWFSSCDIISKSTGEKCNNSVIDIGGGCPKVFGIPLKRKLLVDFFYEGKEYEYNFSKFWIKSKTVFDCHEEADKIIWNVHSKNKNSFFELTGECNKKDMLFINYEAPDGSKKHTRLFNGGNGTAVCKLYDKKHNLIDSFICKHCGCEYGEYEKSKS